ncbi:LacI family DNA-binding transcriptional regulator [Nonomuraea gerenzanensis]|uniref:Transcriptional regulator, LacI family n=1 Tax=Nonomuraea gerenzanensis TaxID=93944 RepID=A0A1M4EFS2_9ACTN|nr:LacI family DNA-binding transcriptional regulator [Nonomuraea gerenzanensis]UBU09352.1 LacI family transcriptional regulator [Nonomuraea gerenzanensis]SBO97765.1 Transcriptional regulator, LacI family [Nonomuraea gerenzanensis]
MSKGATAKRPTIMEVARLAGVSHQTVSRYLKFNGDGMRPATSERIKTAIEQLDYRPNLVARAMRNRRTGRLAILLPAGTAVSSLELLSGATASAHEAGYVVEVVTLGGASRTWSQRALELSDSGLFEGILSLTPMPLPTQRPGSVPIVVSPDYDDHMRGVGELADASHLAELVERLAAYGHRRFMHLAGDYAHTSARRRRQVYLDTLGRLGLESYTVADCGWSAQAARQAVLDLPGGSGVTAIIGANDLVAAGAIRGAWERGWRVPGDVSVTGWDNNPVTEFLPPALTTVDVDHERLGRRVVGRLLAALRGEAAPDEDERLTRVIWRESTGPAPDRAH